MSYSCSLSKPCLCKISRESCAADFCVRRGVSEEHIGTEICNERTTKPLRKKIKQMAERFCIDTAKALDQDSTYRVGKIRTGTCASSDFLLLRGAPLSRLIVPVPNGVVVTELAPAVREMVPSPNLLVVVVVPVEDRKMVPEPNLLVVMVSPEEVRVIAPSPKREVLMDFPSGPRVIQPSPNFEVV